MASSRLLCLAGALLARCSAETLVRKESLLEAGARQALHSERSSCKNRDYVIGKAGFGNCSNLVCIKPTMDPNDPDQCIKNCDRCGNVDSQTDCMEAALMLQKRGLNVRTVQGEFVVGADNADTQNTRPLGCFKEKCNARHSGYGDDEWCFYYNPIDKSQMSDPSYSVNDASWPVCFRDLVIEGDDDSNDCKEEGVDLSGPGGYQPLLDATECLALTSPCNYQAGSPQNVNQANNSKFDDYPVGCFLRKHDLDGTDITDELVYNPKPTNWPRDLPTGPKGKIICTSKNLTALALGDHTR